MEKYRIYYWLITVLNDIVEYDSVFSGVSRIHTKKEMIGDTNEDTGIVWLALYFTLIYLTMERGV